MNEAALEFRISHAHVGEIEAPALIIHTHNPYWSYARHLPRDWDLSKRDRRTQVVADLLKNLGQTKTGDEMDLSPLRYDQRASGIVYGKNPLQNMFDIMQEYAQWFPEHEFFGKWGGGMPELPGKGFAFYAEDERDAHRLINGINQVASHLDIPIEIAHFYGIRRYKNFIKTDRRLRSKVRNVSEFRDLLDALQRYPHYFHELFFEDTSIKKK